MNNSTTGKMSLLAAASLMAITVGMAPPAQAADAKGPGPDSACPKNAQGQSIYIKVQNDRGCNQIKGESYIDKTTTSRGSTQFNVQSTFGKVDTNQNSTQIKGNATQIKGQATHIKIDNIEENKTNAPRDSASGLPTGR